VATLKAIIYTLLKATIGTETLIFSDQNAPRPPLPYWTTQITVQRAVGEDTYSQGVTALGDQTIWGTREATVTVQRIGVDSDAKCADLRDEFSKTSIMESWQLAKIALYDIGDVKNIPYRLDNSQLEPRASLDLFVRFGTELIDRVGIIEQVDATGTIDGNAGLIQTISVVL
jgi:hypothetical protein